ncbi:MAG: hypothetical protein ACRD27_06655 [Terracidiphilus sp.]
MTAALRPMNLGEILDRTFEIYRKRFLLFVGIAALPALIGLGLQLADLDWLHVRSLAQPVGRLNIFVWGFVVELGFLQVYALATIPVVPSFFHSASKGYFGESDSVLRSLHVAVARWRVYLWTGILKWIAEYFFPEVAAVALMIGVGVAGDALGAFEGRYMVPVIFVFILPIAVFCVLLLWMGACFSLAYPIAVLEQGSGWKSMRRSWKLSKGSRLRIASTWLAIAVVSWLLILGVQSVFRWLFILLYRGLHLGVFWVKFYLPLTHALSAAVCAFILPIYPIAITLIYYDQRIRQEGFDIVRMMEAAGMSASVELPVDAVSVAVDAREAQA